MDKLPSHLNSKHLRLFASMLARGFTQSDVMESLSINEAEYAFICNEPRMQRAITEARAQVAESDVLVGQDWDSLEATALDQLKSRVGDGDVDTRDLLAIANSANKADRRRQDARTLARSVNTTLPGQVMNRLPGAAGGAEREVEYEKLTIREKEILEQAPQHITQITSVQTVEDFMQDLDLAKGLPNE